MIDVSDGLAGDLGHLAHASSVGFEVAVERLPKLPGFDKLCRRWGLDPQEIAISGGEDYELLFTVKKSKSRFFAEWVGRKKIPAVPIGIAVKRPGLRFFEKGRPIRRAFHGFVHF